MPIHDGEDVLEWVAANPKVASRHRIIMVTGSVERASTGRVAELRQQLDVPLIAKPWDHNQLLADVSQAVAEIEARQHPAR
jgi:CheY-like chemotaxis protein